jgi:CheY-like chemotaxis protein
MPAILQIAGSGVMTWQMLHQTGDMQGAPHVFLIEDNAGDILLFRRILDDQRIPAHVHVARDGDQAMFMLAEQHFEPDLIVLDLNLPRLSGSSFLAQAKPKAPVVVFSSSTNPVDIKNCVELGAREFVAKPTVADGPKFEDRGESRKPGDASLAAERNKYRANPQSHRGAVARHFFYEQREGYQQRGGTAFRLPRSGSVFQ